MGSECDFFVVVVCLEVTLKSILCQSETPVTKKLLLIALTVRLFVGNWMNCSPCLPTSMKDPAFSFTFEGLKEYSCNHTAYLPGKIGSLLLSRMDEGEKRKKK